MWIWILIPVTYLQAGPLAFHIHSWKSLFYWNNQVSNIKNTETGEQDSTKRWMFWNLLGEGRLETNELELLGMSWSCNWERAGAAGVFKQRLQLQ